MIEVVNNIAIISADGSMGHDNAQLPLLTAEENPYIGKNKPWGYDFHCGFEGCSQLVLNPKLHTKLTILSCGRNKDGIMF